MKGDRRPGISTIGRADDDGETVTITGWGLTWCAARCRCHLHPLTHQLVVADSRTGTLGLATFRTDGRRCDCCQPWTADELLAVHDFLTKVAALPELAA